LLENFGIIVLDRELVSSKEDPPDVLFRSARFEVKELMDKYRPRMAEYRESLAKAETASDAGELLEHHEPRTMPASDVRDLVLLQVQELEKKYPRCAPGKAKRWRVVRGHRASRGVESVAVLSRRTAGACEAE
jgi:hypothetical protein